MNTNDEVKKIIMSSIFFIAWILLPLAVAVYAFYLPYFIKGHDKSIYHYTAMIYQLPVGIVAPLLTLCVVHVLLLFSFLGILQMKERARKALILISVGGLIAYVSVFVFCEVVGQKIPFPVLNCLILSVLIYSFTRPRVKEQFKK